MGTGTNRLIDNFKHTLNKEMTLAMEVLCASIRTHLAAADDPPGDDRELTVIVFTGVFMMH